MKLSSDPFTEEEINSNNYGARQQGGCRVDSNADLNKCTNGITNQLQYRMIQFNGITPDEAMWIHG
jgi:hypothetical protein